VQCWGINVYSELGDGSTTNSATPVNVIGLSGLATALTAGFNHTCVVISGGAVQCWGLNGFGQLGNGSSTNAPSPVYVVGFGG